MILKSLDRRTQSDILLRVIVRRSTSNLLKIVLLHVANREY